ncbi:MAG TPA: hypothetical protein VKY85_20505 [Candidatus Angelobacter sp.]|nr:hypothetical protein [Candidatus Angelobacter sp.]
MPLVTKAVETVSNKLPKIISPRAHAIFDYAQMGIFIVMGAFFWKKNKRASVAAFCCAAAEATNVLLTDYPGGVKPVFSFETHGKIDAAMAGAVASLPNLLGFAGEPQAKHFRIRGGVMAGVTAMTRFKEEVPFESEFDVA